METNIFKNKQFKKKYPIELVPFNKEWLTWYEEEKNQLLYVLRDFSIKVYHIGSTALFASSNLFKSTWVYPLC